MKISIEEIIKNSPQNLEPLEQVRYFYLQLGNILSYNRDYLNISNPTILRDIYEVYITIDMIEKGDYQNKINAICKQHAQVLCDTLNKSKERNIKARTVGYVEGEENHIEVVVEIEGENYNLNINRDLYKIQKGMKTKGFAKRDRALDGTICKILEEEEIQKMDEKIGYCQYGMYMDDMIQMLRKDMEEEQNWEQFNKGEKKDSVFQYKIDFIFKHLKNNQLEKDEMGIYELDKYYRKLYGSLLTEEEKKENKLVNIDIKINEQGKNQQSLLYEIRMKNQNLYYIYDTKEKAFVEITKEKIVAMYENGVLEYETAKPIKLEGNSR